MTNRERLLDKLRPVAFAIAYRMLGSVSEVKDVVREALLGVHQALDVGEQIGSPHGPAHQLAATPPARSGANCAPTQRRGPRGRLASSPFLAKRMIVSTQRAVICQQPGHKARP
jgi:hypothetical protein